MSNTGDRATKLPGIGTIPNSVDPELRAFLAALKEHAEVRNGTRGDHLDRAVTLRDLQASGVVTVHQDGTKFVIRKA